MYFMNSKSRKNKPHFNRVHLFLSVSLYFLCFAFNKIYTFHILHWINFFCCFVFVLLKHSIKILVEFARSQKYVHNQSRIEQYYVFYFQEIKKVCVYSLLLHWDESITLRFKNTLIRTWDFHCSSFRWINSWNKTQILFNSLINFFIHSTDNMHHSFIECNFAESMKYISSELLISGKNISVLYSTMRFYV